MDLHTHDFDYTLPPELIAQEPLARRDQSRLLVLDRRTGAIQHDRFDALASYLQAGDLLVLNRSKVIPARLMARKETGGTVELLLLQPCGADRWIALARPTRRLRPGMRLFLHNAPLSAELEAPRDSGQWTVAFHGSGDVAAQLHRAGAPPLPPYIHTADIPAERYQTVYADREGSVAAPTAGLHFTENLLERLRAAGMAVEYVTLHIGLGTFKPVTVERVEEHHMHPEWGEVPAAVAQAVNRTRASGRRVVAVGTTTTRLLESAASGEAVREFSGMTDRFIYPGYRFQAIDALLTNFHLPRSTLLMLVSAFAGRDHVMAAYQEAIRRRYRFYSFGDAMLII